MPRGVVVLGGCTAFFFGWLFAGGVAFAAHQSAVVRQDFPPRPGGTPIVIGLPNLNPPTSTPGPAHPSSPGKHVLYPVQRDAVRIALTNRYVRALLSSKPYRVTSVTPWAGIGKIVSVGFYHPATITGTWLSAGKPPYTTTIRNVRGLDIYVKLRPGSVIATLPYPRK